MIKKIFLPFAGILSRVGKMIAKMQETSSVVLFVRLSQTLKNVNLRTLLPRMNSPGFVKIQTICN